jgi:hypothetical protein
MTTPSVDRQQGVALFVVLAMSALLTTLVGVATSTGVSAARAAAIFANIIRADELGRGAGDIVSFKLATESPEALRGGRLTARLPDAEIAIEYLSESARIDANAAPVALIAALLTAAGAEPLLVNDVSDRINISRRQAEGGARSETVSPLNQSSPTLNLVPATRRWEPPAIQNTLDLVRAWGLPEVIGRRVLPALTVVSGSKQIDPLLANRLILLALFGGDEARVDDYMTRRAQGFVDTDAALALLPVPAQDFASLTDVKAVRAVARVTIARRFERSYEIILVPSQKPGRRPIVVSWRKLL